MTDRADVRDADASVCLGAEIDRRVNFALQQNDVPVVKAVRVDNGTDETLRDLRLSITAEPPFAEPWETRIDRVAGRSTYNLPPVDLILSPRALAELTERVRGTLRFELTTGGERIAERVEVVELLAPDEWSGLGSLPEILAAFVMPNHPVVARILRDAAEILGSWSGDPSLAGYQSRDARRLYTTAAAIYAALARLDVTYVNPPASFEAEGQRIRLPDRVAEFRQGTCLDLAVLAAGCLEQAGLHPLVVLVEGHALAGLWLQPECFAEPATDEPLRLRKRVDLGEIAVFDPTCVTLRPAADFGSAVAEARRRLERPEEFLCAIDVRRARQGGIRPLPQPMEMPGPAAGHAPPAAVTPAPDTASVEAAAAPVSAGEGPEAPATRLDRWRRRLLDLTLRNRLLNWRETKKTITLLAPDASALVEALADGASFHVLPLPPDLGEVDPRDPDAHRRRTGSEGREALLREALQARRVHANIGAEELGRRLLEVYRAARTGLEEGGASALYLAIGSLAWYETPESTERRVAPILLLPLELHRQSAREGFTLRLGDDEPRINVTLLELLKQDHGVLVTDIDPLPETEVGVDAGRVLRAFRRAIRDIDRWDVLDTVGIGIFSFVKFLMWRDLAERADELVTNPVVDHLVNRPDQPFDPGASFPDPGRLDDTRTPLETFCPLPADASQLAAVFAAAEGRSFVLEGPPGTGKSQTIANLVAHCLTEGKTVLFVSEKMAALDVVHDRLQKIGLGRHCLELHSNKAHKADVLARLDDALRRHDAAPPEDWERAGQRLAGLRRELNAYVEALHRRRSTGDTVFEATSRLIGLRDVAAVELRWPSADALDAQQLAALRDLVERLATAAAAVGGVADHPWQAARRGDWTPVWEQEVNAAVARLADATETLEREAVDVATRLHLGEAGFSLDELALIDEACAILLASPDPPHAILVRPDWDEIDARIGSWVESGRLRDALRTQVLSRFRPGIMRLDLEALRLRLRSAEASPWPLRPWRRRAIRRALAAASRTGKAPAGEELGWVLETARALRDEEQALGAAGKEARALLGHFWRDGEAEWKSVEAVRAWTRRFRSLAVRAAGDDAERAARFRAQWARVATEGRDLLRRDGAIGRRLVAFRSAYAGFCRTRTAISELLDVDTERTWGTADAPDALGVTARVVRGWAERRAQLREWCAWRRVRAEAVGADLGPLVEACERGELASEELRVVFERSYYGWWHDAVVSAEPVLAQFFSPEHQRKIEQFREVDERYMELTREVIAARLAARVPASTVVDLPSSEVGVLKRELGKKRGHMALRRLFEAIPNLLPRLTPCLLMSPLSVAQYLSAVHRPFDVVVFDEASQIPVWDAIGAIARGTQAVIVGDPQQLPPTTFFQRAEGTEDEAGETEVVQDLESILDECIGARLPSRALAWHYRSRHESLIAFSNYHYYGNRLLVFPSPHRSGVGVSWRPVPGGVYDRGRSATNRAEADAIVAEIVRRVRDPWLRTWSIGVVAFSQAQQTLIEDLLEQVRVRDAEVDACFSERVAEPIFVKNLENVQGDERDVVLFSVCYGPDAEGRVWMNLGPINQEGGERRLNVAITRARREILVFSTVTADQIDLARTRARGVRDLKRFLAYAERGPSAIAETTSSDRAADVESSFASAVRNALIEKGWQVQRQIGCASYRIDLAVVDPDVPGRYLLGIECDGANYRRAHTARDRDKLRDVVLRGLGWELHRMWSTDWWTNPDEELRKLEAAIARASRAPRVREAEAMAAPALTPVAAAPATAGAPDAVATESAAPAEEAATPAPAASPIAEPASPAANRARRPRRRRVDRASLAIYSPHTGTGTLGTQEDFYRSASDATIREAIAEVVKHEGPVSLGLAARRIAPRWGFERPRGRFVARVRRLLAGADVLVQSSAEGTFLSPTGVKEDADETFRVPGTAPESFRDPDDLPVNEVANAVLFLLRQHVSAPEDDLVQEARRLFGFRRRSAAADARMRAGITHLVAAGRARRDGSLIVL